MVETEPAELTIAHGSVALIREEAMHLLREHFAELEFARQGFEFRPWWTAYQAIEDEGRLLVLTAHRGETIVGYSVVVLQTCAHDCSQFLARSDLLFVARDQRHGGVAKALMAATETAAKRDGCTGITWHSKPGTQFEAVLDRMGYEKAEVVYFKRFG